MDKQVSSREEKSLCFHMKIILKGIQKMLFSWNLIFALMFLQKWGSGNNFFLLQCQIFLKR